jgi:hypothetical protein
MKRIDNIMKSKAMVEEKSNKRNDDIYNMKGRKERRKEGKKERREKKRIEKNRKEHEWLKR